MPYKKVIVIGLDGLEPKIVESMMASGRLPNLSRLRDQGGFSRIATTVPAQTPVAWSSFATGTNPGGHGIFDFIRRDPRTYLPDLGLNRYEQTSAFVPPKVVNLRRGTPVWKVLSAAGIPSIILRCPCTYGPDEFQGRMLSGMGVPDLRGGLGTSTWYTTADDAKPGESENVVRLEAGKKGTMATHIIGPRNPKTRSDLQFEIEVELGADQTSMLVRSAGEPRQLTCRQGEWSDWLRVRFKLGLLQSIRGMTRLLLVRTHPQVEFYASPVNFDTHAPLFPISAPADFARKLADDIGTYHTAGMIEDHGGLNNGRIDETAFLRQCEIVWNEREAMMLHELERFDKGMFFCLFDTPDRVQHMFWRYLEPNHPTHRGQPVTEMVDVIADTYRRCDAIVGKVAQYVDEQTLLIALSDHGFNSFQRGVHLNTWLHDNGLLALKPGVEAGEEAGDFLRSVDWSRTKAYALGLGGIYFNQKGREGQGIVSADETAQLTKDLIQGLSGLRDVDRNCTAITRVSSREQVYWGPYASESPDLVAQFAAGYRASWSTALGGVARGYFEDNLRKWGGDHIIDPELVPGVLFMNRQFQSAGPRLIDMAPTILAALGVGQPSSMEGLDLLS